MSVNVTAIIPAGGIGLRMGQPEPKQFLEISGLPILLHTIKAIQSAPSVKAIILVAPEDFLDKTSGLVETYLMASDVKIVAGGETRQDSVRAGLDAIPDTTDYVLVHDCARPLVDVDLIENCITAAVKNGAAIAAVPCADTLKEASGAGSIGRTVDRSNIWQAQTPQVVEAGVMREVFASAYKEQYVGTDEASLLERYGLEVKLVPGSPRNLKITGPDDLILAEALFSAAAGGNTEMSALRVGQGYDAHQLVEGRDLVLGGVSIDYGKGLLGHSDADVLVHALIDALLGGAGLGDIGQHFPDSDNAYKGISSIDLLSRVMVILEERKLEVVNCDLTIIAQKPKLSPFIPEMVEILGRVCQLDADRMNIKATTTEKMGYIGREEGIAAQAVVLLRMRLNRI